ncbi:MAG: hypothetical protein JWM05_2201 [Acidimicrobiales bacterium]|nr:hypothetical protein [Acidimicrobiales bacterium]
MVNEGASPDVELSAIAEGVDALAGRVAALADRFDADESGDTAASLYEVERGLLMAARSLNRTRRGI